MAVEQRDEPAVMNNLHPCAPIFVYAIRSDYGDAAMQPWRRKAVRANAAQSATGR